LIERKDKFLKNYFDLPINSLTVLIKHFRFFKGGGSYLSENKVSLVSRNLRVK